MTDFAGCAHRLDVSGCGGGRISPRPDFESAILTPSIERLLSAIGVGEPKASPCSR